MLKKFPLGKNCFAEFQFFCPLIRAVVRGDLRAEQGVPLFYFGLNRDFRQGM